MKIIAIVLTALFTVNYVYAQNTAWPGPTDNSNVGIGTASPSAKLDILGNARIISTSANGFVVGNAQGNYHLITSGASGNTWVYTLSTQNFETRTDGNTGLKAGSFVFYNNSNVVAYQQPLTIMRSYPGYNSNSGLIIDNDNLTPVPSDYRIASFKVSGIEKAYVDQSGGSYFGGNVGIGTVSPPTVGSYGVLALNVHAPSQGGYFSLQTNGVEVASMYANTQFNVVAASGYLTQFYSGTNPTLQIGATGNVIIGKTSQVNINYKLDVAGQVRADRVVVNTTGADFVFKPNYNLRPLAKVEDYIKANQHLPDVPSAVQMQTQGMDVGELNKKLLQKVEELTLYLIEKDKEIKRQKVKTASQLKAQQQATRKLQLEMDQLRKQLKAKN